MEFYRELVWRASLNGDHAILRCLDDADLRDHRYALTELFEEFYSDPTRDGQEEILEQLAIQLENLEMEFRSRNKPRPGNRPNCAPKE
jgi:hypothetical protein